MTVWFVDTSVLLEILEVPGKSQQPDAVRALRREREAAGDFFVLPIATVVETGNHIAQARDRRGAGKLVAILQLARTGQAPFLLHQVEWDDAFVEHLCDGDGIGEPWIDLATAGRFGTGDVSILVERDRFVEASAFHRDHVRIWTLENEMAAYS